jgi:carboxyl-terminal processing protease
MGEKEENKVDEIIARASVVQPRAKRTSNGAFTVAVGIVALLVGLIVGGNLRSVYNWVAPVFNLRTSETLDLSSVQDLYQTIRSRYVGEIDDEALILGAQRGLVSALDDPYSTFMTPAEENTLINDIQGNFSGIGAELSLRNNAVTVIRLIQNSPAQRSGLQVGDIIHTVDGVDMTTASAAQAANAIRGEAGTDVELVVVRDGRLESFTITRARINNPSVHSEVVGVGGQRILRINITSFSTDAGDLALAQAQNALRSGSLDGIILDLRGNGGGYVQAAQSVAALWLDNQPIMSEQNINRRRTVRSLSGRNILADIPTVIITNGSSASASEIVAGALRDHGYARIVGDTTYGKGSMQELMTLRDGNHLRLTIANWFTPNDMSVIGQGLVPDEEVGLTMDDLNAGRDPQFDAAVNMLTK